MEFVTLLQELGIPSVIVGTLVLLWIISQIVGEIIEKCGKTVPAWLKIRKAISEYLANKKEEKNKVKKALEAAVQQNMEIKNFLAEVKSHYDADNIAKRDKWMLDVNSTMHWAKERAKVYDASVKDLIDLKDTVEEHTSILKEHTAILHEQVAQFKLNNELTSQLYKDINRNRILDFAHGLVNARKAEKPVIYSREEFRKIHRVYEDYEKFLRTFGGTNGEVDDAMKIVRRAEAGELPNIEFLEDLRD